MMRPVLVALLAFTLLPLAPVQAGQLADAREIVADATQVINRFRTGEHSGRINALLEHAKGVLVFPSLVKGGLIFGGEGGTGVLVARGDDGWTGPAFYTTASASYGLQIGVQESEVILLIMNEKALRRALNAGLELGADASIAAGPRGMDTELSTTNLLQDIYFYARTKQGLFAGISLEGSVITKRDGLNEAYYNQIGVSPHAIILQGNPTNAHGNGLKKALGP